MSKLIPALHRLGAASLFSLVWLASGCGGHAPPSTLPTLAEVAGEPRAPRQYVIQPGDLIAVKFYHNPELNERVVIRPDGKISLLLVGDLEAAGKQPEALAAEIEREYARELARPAATVIVRRFGGYKVHVAGQVQKPGAIPLEGQLTLYQAIQEAEGFLPTAHRKQVILIRRDENGKPKGHAVDLRPVESGEDPGQDLLLQPYDAVFVPNSTIGDVNYFVEYYIRRNLPVSPGLGFTTF